MVCESVWLRALQTATAPQRVQQVRAVRPKCTLKMRNTVPNAEYYNNLRCVAASQRVRMGWDACDVRAMR